MYFKKRTYYSFESIEEVNNRIKDFSKDFFSVPNLWSRKIDENSFIITQKFSLVMFDSFYLNPALIEVNLVENPDRTKIECIIRNSYIVYLAQILFIGIFIFGLLNIPINSEIALGCIFFSILMILLTHFFHTFALKRLQKSFESSMDLI